MNPEVWAYIGVFATVITIPIAARRFVWWLQDRAWRKMAEKRLDAASRGVDTSFMDRML